MLVICFIILIFIQIEIKRIAKERIRWKIMNIRFNTEIVYTDRLQYHNY